MDKEAIFKSILDSAFEVHKFLGPGLLESTYKQCLAYELKQKGFSVEVEKFLPVIYKDIEIDCAYRIDILVENMIIIELKSVDHIIDLYTAQILSYMKLAKIDLGLLVNFNTKLLKDGIHRYKL